MLDKLANRLDLSPGAKKEAIFNPALQADALPLFEIHAVVVEDLNVKWDGRVSLKLWDIKCDPDRLGDPVEPKMAPIMVCAFDGPNVVGDSDVVDKAVNVLSGVEFIAIEFDQVVELVEGHEWNVVLCELHQKRSVDFILFHGVFPELG